MRFVLLAFNDTKFRFQFKRIAIGATFIAIIVVIFLVIGTVFGLTYRCRQGKQECRYNSCATNEIQLNTMNKKHSLPSRMSYPESAASPQIQ